MVKVAGNWELVRANHRYLTKWQRWPNNTFLLTTVKVEPCPDFTSLIRLLTPNTVLRNNIERYSFLFKPSVTCHIVEHGRFKQIKQQITPEFNTTSAYKKRKYIIKRKGNTASNLTTVT